MDGLQTEDHCCWKQPLCRMYSTKHCPAHGASQTRVSICKNNLRQMGGTLRNGAKNAEINDGEEDAFRFMSSTHKLS